MLFDQLPVAVNAFLMALSCAIKHTAASRLAQTRWFRTQMRTERWYWQVVLLALPGGVGTYLIFDKFIGWPWAIYLALIDAALFALSGVIIKRVKLFDLTPPEFARKILLIRAYHVLAYGVYIWLTLSFR
jgi:hypothetical protein